MTAPAADPNPIYTRLLAERPLSGLPADSSERSQPAQGEHAGPSEQVADPSTPT